MTHYQLTLNLDRSSLKNIYDVGQAVAICKTVHAFSGTSADPNEIETSSSNTNQVAWLVFQPLMHNQIDWLSVETYYLYATTTPLDSGAAITMNSISEQPVPVGSYTFAQGYFSHHMNQDNTYSIDNQMQNRSCYGFGLAQQATVNNVSVLAPQNVQLALYSQSIEFTPSEKVSIFLMSKQGNGVFIASIPEKALTFSVTAYNTRVEIGFNNKDNTFYLQELRRKTGCLANEL